MGLGGRLNSRTQEAANDDGERDGRIGRWSSTGFTTIRTWVRIPATVGPHRKYKLLRLILASLNHGWFVRQDGRVLEQNNK